MFVKYQIGRLNLRRLTNAQLVAGDYLAKTNRVELSPHYVEILEHLSKFSRYESDIKKFKQSPGKTQIWTDTPFRLYENL